MKKVMFACMLAMAGFTMQATAQTKTKVVEDKTTVKKTSTIPQKVHNTFSKHKHYSGKKIKHVKKVEKDATMTK